MNILADFHHSALLRSFILLFENRLGHKVYRPIGMEWQEKGFWKVYDHPATALQFLTLDQGYLPIDGTPPLNRFFDTLPQELEKDVYYCADPENENYNKAITFEKFLEMDIDVIIASMPQHIEPFQRLIREHKPNAKLIFQIGNNWNVPEGLEVKNVMASAKIAAPAGVNYVQYHQEFDLDVFHPMFYRKEPPEINSFVNILQHTADWPLFLAYEQTLPDFRFHSFGGQCRNGLMNGTKELAEAMRASRFIWHVKPGGDGYGHVIHNAFAVGRPVITRKSHYAGCLAEDLMVDGVTCIDLDARSLHENVALINRISNNGELWEAMAHAAADKFTEVVNFNREADDICQFLQRLV